MTQITSYVHIRPDTTLSVGEVPGYPREPRVRIQGDDFELTVYFKSAAELRNLQAAIADYFADMPDGRAFDQAVRGMPTPQLEQVMGAV